MFKVRFNKIALLFFAVFYALPVHSSPEDYTPNPSVVEKFVRNNEKAFKVLVGIAGACSMLFANGFISFMQGGIPDKKPLKSDTNFKNLKRAIPTQVEIIKDCFYNPSNYAKNSSQKRSFFDYIFFWNYFRTNKNYNLHLPQNILLHGQPGTGKTELVRALAGEGIPVFYQSMSGVKDKFFGNSEKNLRDLYAAAEQYARDNNKPFSIVALDEIDAIGRKRSMMAEHSLEHSVQNQLLTLLDGADKGRPVVTIGMTNQHPNALDEALVRSGRFDFHIEIENPSLDEKKEIIKMALAKTTMNRSPSCDELVAKLPCDRFSSATCASIAKSAALAARFNRHTSIRSTDFTQALGWVTSKKDNKVD